MKRYLVMVRIRSNDPNFCYDTFTTEYNGIPYENKDFAERIARKAERSESRIVNSWVEEREVSNEH